MPNTDSNATTSSSETKDETGLDELAAAIDFSAPAKQEARAYLRERFLRVITGIVGKDNLFNEIVKHFQDNNDLEGYVFLFYILLFHVYK